MTVFPYAGAAEHLRAEFHLLNLRLQRRLVEWRAERRPDATPDELAGLYISEADVAHLMSSLYPTDRAPGERASLALLDRIIEAEAKTHAAREALTRAAAGWDDVLRLPLLVERLELSPFERGALALALAAECDRRYERLFGYLNDDLTQRLPTPMLAAALYLEAEARPLAVAAFAAHAPLRALRLIRLVEGGAVALAGTPYRLDDAALAFLLEGQVLDTRLSDVLEPPSPAAAALPMAPAVLEALDLATTAPAVHPERPCVINLHGPDVVLRRQAAVHVTGRLAPALVLVRGRALAAEGDAADRLGRLRRHCRLLGAALAIEEPSAPLPPSLFGCARVTLLLTDEAWQGETPAGAVIRLAVPAPDTETRASQWRAALAGAPVDADLLELADRFRLDTGQLAAAAATARLRAGSGPPLSREELFAACRQQLSRELRGLAQPVETTYDWDDLILPAVVKEQLMALEAWVRHRYTVLQSWDFGRKTAAQGGLAALFSGPSGTGKTVSAGILGRSLGLDVYRIDLSAVVSKYIGETEKNLERIFRLAVAANAILFFDEADALFGKRSEVQDAHDRYANIEVSYLLQRMESYPGIAILTTNFKQNIDPAFLRRFPAVIEFPFPQAEEREQLWRALIPAAAPLAGDVDFAFLGEQFALTGGNIRNCALFAAYSAAAAGQPIGMRHLVRAVAGELEKMEQPLLRTEFGPYYDWVRAPAGGHNGAGR